MRGDRERALGELLAKLGYRRAVWPRPRVEALPTLASDRIMELYRAMGGTRLTPRLTPGGWDHPMVGTAVELDEEQHFTRYRALTLSPEWAARLPWREAYTEYATLHEAYAVAHFRGGGFWTNAGAEALFGRSAAPGDLTGAGSARWKQRALYDAIRDVAALTGQVTLARLSVYDSIGSRTLGAVLRAPHHSDLEQLGRLIEQRTFASRSATANENKGGTDASAPDESPTPIAQAADSAADRRPLAPRQLTLNELTRDLGRSPQAIRHALREEFRPHSSQRGQSWDPLSAEMVEFARRRFG